MAEWKTHASDEESAAEETPSRSPWIRMGGWLLRAFWGFVAGNALAILYFIAAVASQSGITDTSGLFGMFIGFVAYPIIVALVMLVWVAAAALAPVFRGQLVQAVASLAVCGCVAVTIYVWDPAARPQRHVQSMARADVDARSNPKEVARQAEMDPDPLDPAKRAALERREKDYAYGNYVPRPKGKPAPDIPLPRVERSAENDYSKVPEIHVSRPGGDVLLTNHSTQVLRVSATLLVPAGSSASGCAVLRAPDGYATGDVVMLKPRQPITLHRRDACPGTEAAAVQLEVWNDQQQPSAFRLIHER